MIEVYHLTQYPLLFPRKKVGTFSHPLNLMKKLGLSLKEASAGLNGEIVLEKYVFEFTPQWLHDLAVNMVTEDNPEGLGLDEISLLLGIDVSAAKQRWDRAKRKLRENGRFEKLLRDVRALRKLRNGNEEYELHITGKISVAYDD